MRCGTGQGRCGHSPRAFALLAVLIFIFLLSMIAASLLFQSAADESATLASTRSEQAWAAAMSGVAEVLRIAPSAGGPELDWQDNPARFKHQQVFDDGADTWFFTVFSPAPADSLAPVRYGLLDEASLPRKKTEDSEAPADRVVRDPDLTWEGRPRTRIDDPSDPLPERPLPPEFTNYVAALRASGTKVSHPAVVLDGSLTIKDARGVETTIPSGITKDELPLVLDLFTARMSNSHPALLNVNTASSLALAQVPGIDLPLAESIVSTRNAISPDRRRTLAWLVQEGTLDAERFKAVAPHLTARSYQFQCRVAGYAVPSGRFCVVELLIDTTTAKPQLLRLRDVTRLGFPLDFEKLKDSAETGPDQALAPFPGQSLREYPAAGVVLHLRHG